VENRPDDKSFISNYNVPLWETKSDFYTKVIV